MLCNNLLIKKYHIIFKDLIIKKLEMKQTHFIFKINSYHKQIKIKIVVTYFFVMILHDNFDINPMNLTSNTNN
mgnify:CR=1 FL=1